MIDAKDLAMITVRGLMYADVAIKDAPGEPQANSESQEVGMFLFSKRNQKAT